MNESTYISTIIEKCRSELQRRETETMDIPKIAENIDETKPNPEPKNQSAFIEEVDDEEEFKTHTLNPLDKDDLSLLIGLMDSMEPEEVWINARTNVATACYGATVVQYFTLSHTFHVKPRGMEGIQV